MIFTKLFLNGELEFAAKEITESVKSVLNDSIREKSIWEKAYRLYSNNPTQVTIGVVAIVVSIYALYLFKFDGKYNNCGSNNFKVTKYKEEIERFKKNEADKLKSNTSKDSGGLF